METYIVPEWYIIKERKMSILYNLSKKNNQGNEKENDKKGAVLDGLSKKT